MIAAPARETLLEALDDRVRFDFPLARCTSLRVGGPAAALATPATRAELAQVLAICARHRIAHIVLGSGFNTLALDGGYEGIAIQLSKLRRLEERPGPSLRAEAGVSHSQVANFCMQRGYAGLEFGAGIPGTVGGWLAMNAGIPGSEIGDAVREVEVMSPTGRSLRHLPHRSLRFTYRSLRGLAPGSVLVSTLLAVRDADPAAVRTEVDRQLARRADSQPLDVPSCGSVFVNPPGDHAGRLIEAAGLKGLRIGGAQISPVHANFIANLGGATARDVLALIDAAQKAVRESSGVRLVPEVRIIGSKR